MRRRVRRCCPSFTGLRPPRAPASVAGAIAGAQPIRRGTAAGGGHHRGPARASTIQNAALAGALVPETRRIVLVSDPFHLPAQLGDLPRDGLARRGAPCRPYRWTGRTGAARCDEMLRESVAIWFNAGARACLSRRRCSGHFGRAADRLVQLISAIGVQPAIPAHDQQHVTHGDRVRRPAPPRRGRVPDQRAAFRAEKQADLPVARGDDKHAPPARIVAVMGEDRLAPPLAVGLVERQFRAPDALAAVRL